MAWPFPEYLRPLMRDVLFWHGRGMSDAEVYERLTGPTGRHRSGDVELAMPEARRAAGFAAAIAAADPTETLGQIWDRSAESIWRAAYGRGPTESESEWWLSRPGESVGLMTELTVEGAAGFRWTPTLNAGWSDSLADVSDLVRRWLVSGFRSPPPPNSVEQQLGRGGKINVRIIGGALVPRIDPTI